jgi:hypothetical protein
MLDDDAGWLFDALTGSLWPILRPNQLVVANLKYLARADISEFESFMPSQRVRSLSGMSGSEKLPRHPRYLEEA